MKLAQVRALALVAGLALLFGIAPSTADAPRAGQKPPASQHKKPYEPKVGQEGKDVVWVPTAETMVERMLDLAKVSPQDYVVDLGSGDGRLVIAAAKRGARAHGVEYNPDMVEMAERKAHADGVAARATFERANLFHADLSRATVITMFLLPLINLDLRPRLLALKPGTRVVSNTFTMGDWQPDATAKVTAGCENYCDALLWIVPAKVEGTWQLLSGRLTLKQAFQRVTGSLAAWGATRPIREAWLRGNRFTFRAAGESFEARVDGDTMQGTVTTGRTTRPFRATRVPAPR